MADYRGNAKAQMRDGLIGALDGSAVEFCFISKSLIDVAVPGLAVRSASAEKAGHLVPGHFFKARCIGHAANEDKWILALGSVNVFAPKSTGYDGVVLCECL